MGIAYSQPMTEMTFSVNPNDAPIFDNIQEYQKCKLSSLNESFDTWKDICGSKRLVTFEDFDEIFGHILGDPEEHFGIFTGDDVKKRAKAKAMAMSQLRKMHGKDSLKLVGGHVPAAVKRRRTRAGSTSLRSSISAGGSISGASLSFGQNSVANQSIAQMAMNMVNATRMGDKTQPRISASQIEKYKRGAMIDVFDVFAILALLCNEEVEPKLMFLFVFFGRNGSKHGGLDHKQFADLVDRVTSAIYKLLGNCPPDKRYSEMVVLNLYGKKGNMHREVMTFKEIWDWCQDEVEVANYLQKVFQFSLTPNSMYKQEVAVNTDSYLQNSKLMEGDSDDEDGSGIEKARPLLWNELVKGMATKAWWEDLPTAQESEMNLAVLRKMWEKDKSALGIFAGKRYQGVVDSMALAKKLVKAWSDGEKRIASNMQLQQQQVLIQQLKDTEKGRKGSVVEKWERRRNAALPVDHTQAFANVAADFCYQTVSVLTKGTWKGWGVGGKGKSGRGGVAGDDGDEKGSKKKETKGRFDYAKATEPLSGHNGGEGGGKEGGEVRVKKKQHAKKQPPLSISEPCLSSQFMYSLLYRFARGSSCALVSSHISSDPSSYVHLVTEDEIATWVARRSELLGESKDLTLLKLQDLIRRPLVVLTSDSAKVAFEKLIDRNCNSAAIVDAETELFVGEIRIEDIRNIARKEKIAQVPEGANVGSDAVKVGTLLARKTKANWGEVGRVMRETIIARNRTASNSGGQSPGGRGPSISPAMLKRQASVRRSPGNLSPKTNNRRLNVGGGDDGGTPRIPPSTSVAKKTDGSMSLTGDAEADSEYLMKFGELLLPVCSYLVEAECGNEREVHERKELLSSMKFKFEGFKGKKYEKRSMIEEVCSAFSVGIGPQGRERQRTRMMLMQKKTGSLLVGKGKVGAGPPKLDYITVADVRDGFGESDKDGTKGGAKGEEKKEEERKEGGGETAGDNNGAGAGGRGRKTTVAKKKETMTKGGLGWEKLRKIVKGDGEGKSVKGKRRHKGEGSPKKGDKASGVGGEEVGVGEGVEEQEKGVGLRMGLRRDQTVVLGDSLAHVVGIMASEKKGRVYVTNSVGRTLGVVTIADICRLILKNCEEEVFKILEAKDDDEEEEEEDREAEEEAAKKLEIEQRMAESKAEKSDAGAMIDALLARKTMTGMKPNEQYAIGGQAGGEKKEGTTVTDGGEKGTPEIKEESEMKEQEQRADSANKQRMSMSNDQRPSITVLYEMKDNKDFGGGSRVRADTGQLEDVITLPGTRNRIASLVLEEDDEEGGDDDE